MLFLYYEVYLNIFDLELNEIENSYLSYLLLLTLTYFRKFQIRKISD